MLSLVDPVISGGVVAVFSFAIARGWDVLGTRRDRWTREKAVLLAIREEIRANRERAVNNQQLVMKELALLKQDRRLINPFDPLGEGFWELVRLDPPRSLAEGQGLVYARRVARLTTQVNEMIRSRERFRAPNQALQGLNSFLQKYDELIQRFQGELLEAIDALDPLLEPPPSPWREIWRTPED
jgi:hypothetical protein